MPSVVLAQQNWTQKNPANPIPGPRDSASMVYDPVRHQTVLFGGQEFDTLLNETWVWDGTSWTLKNPSTKPPARLWAGMAFDAKSGHVVLFSGTANDSLPFTFLADTWEWDGTNWTQKSPVVHPSGRQAPAMTYDSRLQQVVLFGGQDAPGGVLTVEADTWTWDGTNWNAVETDPTQTPAARRFATMSYDPVLQNSVLFGGDTGTVPGSIVLGDTWTWDGSQWAHSTPAHSPSARDAGGQVWDPVRQLTVLFGGNPDNQTWLWNGFDWTQDITPASPPSRFYGTVAYDIQHDQVVLFGGLTASFSGLLNDTWTLGYTYTENWMLFAGAGINGPGGRSNTAFGTDGTTVYMFGGTNGNSVLSETWQWIAGDEWSLVPSSLTPPARRNASMALSQHDGKFVMFGGNSSAAGTTLLGDTWLLDSSGWSQPEGSFNSPPAREAYGLVYDGANDNLVLFGGSTAGGPVHDTWIWTSVGAGWTPLFPSTSPPARLQPSMVFDGARSQVLMFGGFINGVYLNDTWVWDGVNWTQLNPANSPPGRDRAMMIYDSVHGRVQLFGGQDNAGSRNDMWQWDGVNWTQLTPATSPGARFGAAAAYVPFAQQSFMFGGTDGVNQFADTWVFSSPSVTTTILPTGFSGQPYSYTVAPSGGLPPYTFTGIAAPFSFGPTGLSLNANTGAITGTDTVSSGQPPLQLGIFIKDAQGQNTLTMFELPTDVPINFAPGPLPGATMGNANYSYPLSASGGTPPFTFTAVGLPAGMSINGSNIVGTCAASSNSVVLTVTDSVNGKVSSNPLALACNLAPSITSTSPLPPATLNVPYNVQLTASGGSAPLTWSVPPSSLPPGLSMNGSGLITGSPTNIGISSFTVTLADRWNSTVNVIFQITVQNQLSITATQLANGTLNVAYPAGQAVTIVGGTPAFNFSANGLPPGLSINSANGAITGTPTTAGAYTPQFSVNDQASGFVQKVIPITVAAAGTISEDWVQQFPASPPPGRVGAAAFYDSVHNQTVVFGGEIQQDPGALNDTNVWNGTAWQTLSPANSPSIRAYAAVAFDPAHQKGVLFGGQDQNGVLLTDTWLWDGTNWTKVTPSTIPPARTGAMMAWDGNRVVLFGGTNYGGDFNDTWLWDGTNWSLFAPPTSPTVRENGAMAFDSVRNKVVLFGGLNDLAETYLADTWIWDGTLKTWTQIDPAANHPPARYLHAMAFDSLRGQAVVFGGNRGNNYLRDTWAWNGTVWTQLQPPHSPSARSNRAMIYDPSHSEIVLFGGFEPIAGFVNDTWLFGGPDLQSLALPAATQNVAYSDQLVVLGGIAPATFVGPAVLPPGITFNALNGSFGGTPTASGNYNIPLTIQDGFGVSIAPQLTLRVITPPTPLTFVTQALSSCLANTSCSNLIAGAGGVPPYAFSVPPNTNLDGLTLSASGVLSGIPASSGLFNIPVTMTDQQGTSIAKTFPLTVIPTLSIITTSFPPGTVGVNYGVSLQASGGTPPYTWSLSSGTLPSGLSLDAPSGIISGKPNATGIFNFGVQVNDGQQLTAPRQFSITISAPPTALALVSPTQLPPGAVGTAYSQNLLASGGSGQYAWTLTGGALPAGLTLAANGLIAGTPTTAQTANFTTKLTDTAGNSINSAFSILITNPATVSLLASNPLPNGAVGVAYNYAIQVTGGTPPYFFSITQGQIPPGLIFDATNGTLIGTPTVKGDFSLVLTVTDSGATSSGALAAQLEPRASGQTRASASYTIQIAGPGDFQITTGANLPNGLTGQAYSTTMAASGGTPPYQWQLVSGSLPAGLTLTPDGRITGTPTAAASTSVLIRATDSVNASVTGNFVLQIANPNIPSATPTPPPPAGTVGVAYTTVLTALGGHAPYSWSISSGALPPGLSLDPRTGSVTGTPSQRGSFPFTVRVSDSTNANSTQAFTIRVNAATLQITPQSLPNGVVNAAYSVTLTASGGTAPYIWSLSAGLLSGFAIDSATGIISGTPAQAGTYQFTITALDANFDLGSQNYQVLVQAGALTITTTTAPAATVNSPYSFSLLAANGTSPLAWSVSAGSLPPGINLGASNGQLTGTPTTLGSYTFTVQVQDATGATAKASLTVVVNPVPLTVVIATLPVGSVGAAYSQTLQSSGGRPPITWSIATGSLPPGLSIGASTGTISGTPTAVGSSSFTAQATDSAGTTAGQAFTISIAGPPAVPAITLSGLPATSNAGDQPAVTITLASAYPLPIVVTATLSITPNSSSSTDLMFSNGSRTTQITIPANTTQSTLPLQVGTLPGTITLSLSLSVSGINVTPAVPPSASTKIAGAAPVIKSVTETSITGGIQLTIVGWSTTLDMKTASFHFTAASGSTLQNTDITVDVSSLFAAWYQSAASQATGSQFSYTIPFTINGNVSTIASVSVTMTNSVGASAAASATIH